MLGRLGASVFARTSGRGTLPARSQDGKSGFSKKKVAKTGAKDKTEMQTSRAKLAKEYEAIGKMARPPIVKPMRTPEELALAKQMTLMYVTEKTKMHNKWRKGEQQRIRFRDIASDELPAHLQAHARTEDVTPFPKDFIVALQKPPLESTEIFGPRMAAEQFKRSE